MLAVIANQVLSTGVPPGQELPASAWQDADARLRDRSARGRPIYANTCAVCHGPDGLARRNLPPVDLGFDAAVGIG
jgi:cytochrome c